LQFLEVLRLRTFDAVILDADLGDISYVETLRRMRGASDRVPDGSPRSEMPAMVIAGMPGEVESSDVLEAGGQGLLEPPLEIVEVAAAMRSLLDQVGT
jgi:DNA-binding response OmpR family regulator